MTGTPTVHQALSQAMADTQAARKDSKNQAQHLSLRDIDDIIATAGLALRKHGVLIFPEDVEVLRSNRTTADNKQAIEAVIKVTYCVCGPQGDAIHGKVAAEAMDSEDGAIAKAMSTAYCTFLRQVLMVPTDGPTSGGKSREKGMPKRTAAEQCGVILDGFCHTHELDGNKVREEYFTAGGKANPDMLRAWLAQNYGAGKVQ